MLKDAVIMAMYDTYMNKYYNRLHVIGIPYCSDSIIYQLIENKEPISDKVNNTFKKILNNDYSAESEEDELLLYSRAAWLFYKDQGSKIPEPKYESSKIITRVAVSMFCCENYKHVLDTISSAYDCSRFEKAIDIIYNTLDDDCDDILEAAFNKAIDSKLDYYNISFIAALSEYNFGSCNHQMTRMEYPNISDYMFTNKEKLSDYFEFNRICTKYDEILKIGVE